MAEDFSKILTGPVVHNNIRIDVVANGAIPQWAPVILIAPAAGETKPRMGTTTSIGNNLIAGVKDWPNKTLVAGNMAKVTIHGVTKLKFDGAAALGAAWQTDTIAGKATSLTVAVIGDVVKIGGKVLSNIVAADNDIGLVSVGGVN